MHADPTIKQLHTIYALIDPRTQIVRYVGVTKVDIKERLRCHLKESRSYPNTRRARWIRQLAAAGLRPHIFPLELTTDRLRECYWIAFFRSMGFDLTNLTDGGEGCTGLRWTEEARKQISRAVAEQWQCPEYRARMKQAHKGYVPTAEQRAKISIAGTGRRHTAESKQKMSKLKTEQHRLKAKEARLLALASGKGRAFGDNNGTRKHPDSTLKGSANPAAKMNEEKVREMRRKYAAGEGSTNTLAREFQVSQAVTWNIINRKTWKHVD